MDVRTGSLLDIVLSHELTHLTRAGLSIDLMGGDTNHAAGWNYCIQNAGQSYQNAENLAMLGAAALMIQDDDVMPDVDGNIVPLSLDRKRANRAGLIREVGWHWQIILLLTCHHTVRFRERFERVSCCTLPKLGE